MGSDFMNQFQAGWQLGQQRNENTRREQELRMEQERQRQEQERRTAAFELQQEEFKLRKKQLAAEEHASRLEAAKEAFQMRTEAAKMQGLPTPTAAEVGVPQQGPEMAGPPVGQVNVPQPMQAMPNPMEGQPDIQMPVLTGPQQQEMAQAAQQRKMRELLGMKTVEVQAAEAAREPFRVRDDERTAARMEAAASRSESRAAAREDKREGKQSLAQENRLRAEFNRESKKLREALIDLDRYAAPVKKSIEAGKNPTPADQFALIYAFNKALDPGSTVREGEFANSRSVGAGVTDQAFLMLERWRSGAQLAPAQVSQMMDTIERARGSTEESLRQMTSKYGELSASYGIDPSKVISLGRSDDVNKSKGSGRGGVTINGVLIEEE